MHAFTLVGWDNFFVAGAGASAAPTRLVFVALWTAFGGATVNAWILLVEILR